LFTLTLLCLVVLAGGARASSSPRDYAHRLVLARWHSEAEWRALDAIVEPESGWDPCAVYPGRHDCGYTGSSSCAIPQANPCPGAWRGRLWETRFAQARWLIGYVGGRYGSPTSALAFRRAHGYY
jgi:hypothetical protein